MSRLSVLTFLFLSTVASIGLTFWDANDPGNGMTASAEKFIKLLDADQKKTAVFEYGSPERLGWHFIPKDERKGLQVKHMTEAQQKAAFALLKNALSETGYQKTRQIMELEKVLNEFEEGKGRWARDFERYYFTFFGNPGSDERWGLSVEGHHLSLNFVVNDQQLIGTTPQFFASNPAIVKNENSVGVKVGTRVLDIEETAAFELVQSLSPEQKGQAIIAEEALTEIRAAGEPQPPVTEPVGIRYEDLTSEQRGMLLKLVNEYINAMPGPVAKQRDDQLHFDGLNKIHFAWAGATEPGIGHYYRVQSPSFLIEFVNTQPDAAGNPANHIHCVWRDLRGDFAVAIED
ncbi:DUF3500 domain-containing protein [Thalassoglobus sp. JC818]|uniref:DUF3500 domain-containing protein n=1 Tax=Thalassoglobus sp. JC818 TaxID=3232136 RepID=UPI00345B0A2E